MTLSRSQARVIVEAAVAHATSIGQQVAVAVLDAAGRTVSQIAWMARR